jgi:hypothetical protein
VRPLITFDRESLFVEAALLGRFAAVIFRVSLLVGASARRGHTGAAEWSVVCKANTTRPRSGR